MHLSRVGTSRDRFRSCCRSYSRMADKPPDPRKFTSLPLAILLWDLREMLAREGLSFFPGVLVIT